MYYSLQYPFWVTLLLAVPAAGFLIRLFIIFHDCGHGSFFKSKKTNDIVGKILGVVLLTPYSPWHYSHKLHHSSAGNLDKRGDGDVWTLTVEEYEASTKGQQLYYRLYRNPWFMFTVGALLMVLVKNRFTRKRMSQTDKNNIYLTNVLVLIMAGSISLLIGVKAYLLIQIPIILISHCIGIWLFYVQHQFDDVYWDNGLQWDYKNAAMEGSSFLKLPRVLQWFTGNIGFHHVHHLSPRIPNYNLARCHYENDLFKDIVPMTLRSSMKTLSLRLWDNVSHRMLTFRQMGTIRLKKNAVA
jgi:omega-6 fatty acid desaturase (delta-12 desaturase)